MESGLFRKKSLERISSPEDLHDYMRVTSPRLWMLLAAILVLLGGFLVYASTANMENTMQIRVQAENLDSYILVDGEPVSEKMTYFYATLPSSYKDILETGMRVRIGNEEGKVDLIALVNLSEEEGEKGGEVIRLILDMDNDTYTLMDGEYDAELVLESTTPISFLWN